MPNNHPEATNGGANLGFERELWRAADALRNNMDAAEYKHVVLGLIFLKYISDAFEAKHAELTTQKAEGADPEDPDEYRAVSIFWVPKEARWQHLKASAPQPTIGKLPYPTEREGVIDRLLGERLIDELNGQYAIRRLGALLLAKKLEDFPDLARKAPRVVVYSGTSKLETRLDQTSAEGYAVGFQGLVRFVMNQLPQNEVIEDALRKEVKLVPEVVIRELVANALIHQDLAIGGASVMVEIYRNRVEISNPGEPLVPVERFIDGYQSRNERLADLMRRMGICEEKSSGIDKVIHAVEAYQLPAPDFRVGYRRTVVMIFGPKAFEDMDRDDRTRACYQHCALKWVMSERMTNQSLRERFHLLEGKSAIISQIIAATIEAGLIKPDERVGASRKFARYLPFWA